MKQEVWHEWWEYFKNKHSQIVARGFFLLQYFISHWIKQAFIQCSFELNLLKKILNMINLMLRISIKSKRSQRFSSK